MSESGRHYKTLGNLLWKNRFDLFLAAVSIFIVSGLLMLVPVWSKALIQNILPSKDLKELAKHLLLGIGLTAIIQIFLFGQDFIRLKLSHRIAASLRKQLFGKIAAMPVAIQPEFQTGDLISRLSNDVTVFQNGLSRGLFRLPPNIIFVLVLIVMMFVYSAYLSLVTLLTIPLLAWTVHFFIGRIRNRAKIAQERVAYINNLINEAIRGLREIKIFGREKQIRDRFDRQNEAALKAQIVQDKVSAIHPGAVLIVTIIMLALLIFFCLWIMYQGKLSMDNFVAFLTCLGLSLSPIQEITRSFGFISRISAVMDRFDEVLKTCSENVESEDYPFLPAIKGNLVFEEVCFSYGENFHLQNIDFSVSAGETVAIVGPSGSGKSTLINLIPRLIDPDSGTIRIDGHDISRFQLKSVRAKIALVAQEPVLFYGTLMDNLAFARPGVSEPEIMSAARAAHMDEFAKKLPKGYDTHIGQFGIKLSVGQRQRIAIARALLAEPQILLLDEPISALDSESEQLIQVSLKHLMKNRTTLIAAHRMSTIRDVNKIIVLDDGLIVEMGTHLDLIQQKGLYHKLYSLQAFL